MVLTATSARTVYGSSSPATPNHSAQKANAKAEAPLLGSMSLDHTQESLAELENPVDELISPRSPWQSPYVERLVGSIRHECLDRIIVFNERQLRRTLESYLEYYHKIRPHRSLTHDSPIPRPVEAPEIGKVIELPVVGGLHHHYRRQAA